MGGGKKNKAYYKRSDGGGKKYKGPELQQGAVGFMFTFVKDRMRGAKAESYELLNTYAAQMIAKSEGASVQADSDADSSADEDCDDIDAALSKQVAQLKETKKSGDKFLYMDTGVNQVLFMKSLVDNHNQLTYKILDDALKGEMKTKSRFLHRMVPVLETCRADMEKLSEGVTKALQVFMTSQEIADQAELTFKAEVKVRNNNDKELTRMNIITLIGNVVKERYPEWRVNLSEPKILIMIDILKKVCCVSVVRDYMLYKKFNLQELAVEFHTEKSLSSGDGRVKAGDKTKAKQTDDTEEKVDNVPSSVSSTQETTVEPTSEEKIQTESETTETVAKKPRLEVNSTTEDKNSEGIKAKVEEPSDNIISNEKKENEETVVPEKSADP